jgi:cytochrome c553
MNRTLSLIALAGLLAASSAASAAGNIENGKKLAETCAQCHGADGNPTDPQYPRLAGQYRNYLEHALTEYKSGKRRNAIMALSVEPLTKQNIADLSLYYSSLPTKLTDLSHATK